MINKLLIGIINLISGLVDTLLSPIDTLIQEHLPGLDSALNSFGAFFNLIGSGISWVLDAFAIPSELIALLVAYWAFKLTVPILFSALKSILQWYDKLKP